MGKIIIVILSEIDSNLVSALSRSLAKTFNRVVEIKYQVSNLKYAYDAKRKQFISPRLLSRVKLINKGYGDKIIAVADVDLYSPGYDFVYGEADVSSGIATLSIHRLINDNGYIEHDMNLVSDRIIREATHEVGHLFGLGHCKNQRCVMRTCTCLPEVDEASSGLCFICRKEIKKNL